MSLVLNDRVLETCTSPGTGSCILLGAATGFRTFSAGVGNGNTCYYTIADQNGGNWEVGLGTYTSSSNSLARTTVLSSSNSGSLVNFNSGTQNVFVTYPAEKSVYLDASGNIVTSGNLTVTGGLYSQGAFSGTYSDGIVVDYTSGLGRISVGSSDGLSIYNGGVGGTALLNLDSSGNLGLGVTPSTTYSASKTLQIGTAGIIEGRVGAAVFQYGSNWYIDSAGAYKYTTTAEATRYATNNGIHAWYTAPSGTAGSAISFTQAMTLTSAGYLGIGTSSPGFLLDVSGGDMRATRGSGDGYVWLGNQSSAYYMYGGTSSNAWAWVVAGSERMRLTSAGYLGIGTSSPSAPLTVSVNTVDTLGLQVTNASTGNLVSLATAGTNGNGISGWANSAILEAVPYSTGNLVLSAYTGKILFQTSVRTTQATLDSSGNLGLGVTPSGWASGFKAFDAGTYGAFIGNNTGQVDIWFNGYYNGTNSLYKNTNYASIFRQEAGAFKFFTAPSGTAGNAISFTQAMTLDASGNLGVGTTNPANGGRLAVYGKVTYAGQNQVALFYSQTSGGAVVNFQDAASANGSAIGGTGDNLIFLTSSGGGNLTEKMRLTSAGQLGIGTTSPNASAILDAQSTTLGVRFPNMTTTQKNAISSPAAGLVVFDTTLAKLCVYSGAAWQTITSI